MQCNQPSSPNRYENRQQSHFGTFFAKMDDMEPVRLYFLGPPRIERDGQVLQSDTRKATALLAYLELTGDQQTRDTLAAFLWPDFDNKRGKAALRRTLSALKSAVGAQALHITREAIGLEAARVWSDVRQFRQLLAQDSHISTLETAVALYRDDFLTGFSLRDSIPFDDWQLLQAQTLRRELEIGLEKLLRHRITRQEYTQALPLAHRWLALDPLREDVHRTLMQLYAWLDQPNAALRQYRDCVRILEEELGVSPLPETTALYETILNDRLAAPPLSTEVDAAPSPPSPLQLAAPMPLVGRAAEQALMQQLYQEIGPDGRFLAIEGETGIGKTRLAENFLAQVGEQGAVILSARCYAGENNLAYAPLIQIIREGIAQADAAARLAIVSPPVLAEAARLLPELADFQNEGVEVPALDAPGAQSRFFESVGLVLMALLNGAVPGVLWLDDGHWLDSASLDLLLFLARRWRQRPYLILLAWRAEELSAGHPLHQVAAEIHRDRVGEQVHLTRFTAEEVAQVVTAADATFQAGLPARLYAETEGLPYFVVAYLADLSQQQLPEASAEAWNIPRTVRDLLHTRLAQVGDAERQLLQTAAVIGHAFTFDLVQTASGRSEEEAVASLEKLLARGILAEETAEYDFSHEKLRALAYEETSLARRRLLHRRLAEALTQQAAHQVQPAGSAGQIAGHYHLAGRDAEAARFFIQAGDYARSLFAHRDALAHYQMALALEHPETAQLHELCGDCQVRLGAYTAALNSYERTSALSSAGPLPKLEQKIGQVYGRLGQWNLAAVHFQRSEGAWIEPADAGELAWLYLDWSYTAYRAGEMDKAQYMVNLAQAQSNTPAMQAQIHNLLGILQRRQGNMAAAIDSFSTSYQLAQDYALLSMEITALNNLALAETDAGNHNRAQQLFTTALRQCQYYGDRHWEAALHSNLADLYHQMDQEEQAMAQLKKSTIIYAEIGHETGEWQPGVWQLREW